MPCCAGLVHGEAREVGVPTDQAGELFDLVGAPGEAVAPRELSELRWVELVELDGFAQVAER